jgi:hypothetical protein
MTIMVDPKDRVVALEHPELNTTNVAQVCSIAKDIALTEKGIGTTGLGQVCTCSYYSATPYLGRVSSNFRFYIRIVLDVPILA